MLGYPIGLIGGGNMGSAILSGALRHSVVLPENVSLSDPCPEKTESFRTQGVYVTNDNREVARRSDILILAVKPQMFDEVLPPLASITGGKCVVSIAAGISTAYIKKRMPNAHVIRVMPNTPLLVGRGITALVREKDVPDEYFEAVRELFSAAGRTMTVNEDQLNGVIALSGSSPAYFFRLISAMAEEGERMGLSRDQAIWLAAGTMEGAAAMVQGSGKTPEELTRQVCSPGGTTLAALSAFDDGGLNDMVSDAMRRCVKRADELGR